MDNDFDIFLNHYLCAFFVFWWSDRGTRFLVELLNIIKVFFPFFLFFFIWHYYDTHMWEILLQTERNSLSTYNFKHID